MANTKVSPSDAAVAEPDPLEQDSQSVLTLARYMAVSRNLS